jgi:hypothetical protein
MGFDKPFIVIGERINPYELLEKPS